METTFGGSQIIDHKSSEVISFFTELDEMLDSISQVLKNRTFHMNEEKYLSNKDVCKMLHVSSLTLQDWRDNGVVPYIQIKGKILYRESEIFLRWLEKNNSYNVEN
jgi:hypothetical protein